MKSEKGGFALQYSVSSQSHCSPAAPPAAYPCATTGHDQQVSLHHCYRFQHVPQRVLFFPYFKYRPNPPSVLGNRAWAQTLKTPTCILFNQERKFKKFGYDAVMKYKSLPHGKADNWYFFQDFKMKLYNTQVTSDMELKAINGKMLPALTIFSQSPCYLKERALNTIQEAYFQTVCSQEEITWFITVPVTWSAAARQFMQLEAKEAKAGVIPFPQIIFGDFPQHLNNLYALTSFVFVCGYIGGTIDIMVHEIQENRLLKELHKATGGGWEGNSVDENFTDCLKKIFNDGVWDEYVQSHPSELRHMMYNFSIQKCLTGRDAIYIHCYYNLTRVAEHKKDISHFFKNEEGAVWCDGMIMITYKKMKSFFYYRIKNIIRGRFLTSFASSIILRDAIRQAFSKKYHILCPMEVQVAIAKGAVLFGVSPHVIASRVSAWTYGIAVSEKFDASIHPFCKQRVSKADGFVYCMDLFKKLVGIEEAVNINEVVHYDFYPTEPDQTEVCFSFYCTEKQDAQYIDEEGLEKLGSGTVPMPDTKLGRKRQLKLDIKFGLTEFKATCTDITSKQSWAIVINFLAV
uniref:Uncharacterized protein n=1 Tax=Falco tinnunculus TaxID=100819 RepID=A0A8C4U9J9_FALTI